MTLAPRAATSRKTTPTLTLNAAIDRGVAGLRAHQRPAGDFRSEADLGPLAIAMTVLTQAWIGALTPREAAGAARTLRRRQSADGGFVIQPYAEESSLGATAVCRAALRASGVPDTDPAVIAAEARIIALGGYDLLRRRFEDGHDLSALFCAMVGLLPPETLPPLSPAMAALPWSERMLDGRMHAGIPLCVYAVAAVSERLRGRARVPRFVDAPARALARARLSAFLGGYQNLDGSWNAFLFNTHFALLALSGLDLGVADPMIARGLAWLRSRQRWNGNAFDVSIFDGEVWETSFAMLALQACGVPSNDDALAAAGAYLLRAQCRCEQPRTNQPDPRAPRTGGWAYQLGNDTMPDCDDTGVAIAALAAHAGRVGARELFTAIDKGVGWIRGMQNASGGIPAYVHGLPDKPPGAMALGGLRLPITDLRTLARVILDPPPDIGDPPTADVVGRVLWGLGASGLDAHDPAVARAIAWLERDACPSGAWWGMWNPAHVSGTAFALIGLAAVQADLEAPAARKAITWLLGVQNADGGWGESARSFHDPSLAGRGPSMAPLTGIALRALAEVMAGGAGSKEVRAAGTRACRHLLRKQLPDGSFPDDGYLFALIPPVQFRWDLHRYYYPLIGLGRWHTVVGGKG